MCPDFVGLIVVISFQESNRLRGIDEPDSRLAPGVARLHSERGLVGRRRSLVQWKALMRRRRPIHRDVRNAYGKTRHRGNPSFHLGRGT